MSTPIEADFAAVQTAVADLRAHLDARIADTSDVPNNGYVTMSVELSAVEELLAQERATRGLNYSAVVYKELHPPTGHAFAGASQQLPDDLETALAAAEVSAANATAGQTIVLELQDGVWNTTIGSPAAAYDRAVMDACVAVARPGVQYLGTITTTGSAAPVPVYVTPSVDGSYTTLPLFVTSSLPQQLQDAITAGVVDSDLFGTQSTAGVLFGYVTQDDSNFVPQLGWQFIIDSTSNIYPDNVTALDWYNTYQSNTGSSWGAEGIPASMIGYVGSVIVSDTTVYIFATDPYVGVALDGEGAYIGSPQFVVDPTVPQPDPGPAPTSNLGTDVITVGAPRGVGISGPGLPNPPYPGPYTTLSPTGGEQNWTATNSAPADTPAFTDPVVISFNEGDVTVPSALADAVNGLLPVLPDNGAGWWLGVAMPYVIYIDNANFSVQDYTLTDSWVTDPSYLTSEDSGLALLSSDETDADPQQMAIDMGLTDADGWSFLGSITLDSGEVVEFFTTKPNDVWQITGGSLSQTTDDTGGVYNTGTWTYITLGGMGGGGFFPANYTYDPSTTIADPGAGKFRFSATGVLADDYVMAISCTDADGNNTHDAIIANNPPDNLSQDGLWRFDNEEGAPGFITGQALTNMGDTGYAITDHTTWVEIPIFINGNTGNMTTDAKKTEVQTPVGG